MMKLQLFAIISLILLSALSTIQSDRTSAIYFAENLQNKIGRLETSEATGLASHVTLKTPFSHDGDLESHFDRFFTEFPIFSISDYRQQLKWIKKQQDPHFPDRFSAFFDQQHKGIKVFGARLHLHFNQNREITAADASIIPDLEKLPIHFMIGEDDAIAIALRSFYSKLNQKEGAIVEDIQKMIYREGLFAARKGENHLTWMVIVSDQLARRDRIFIDAKSGEVLVTIPLVHSIHREAWKGKFEVGKPYWEEGDPFPTNSSDANLNLNVSLAIYTAFQNAFNYTSFDDLDSKMITIFDLVDNKTDPICPNAFWNGTLYASCPGVDAFDVAAHEWGHAYDQFTADLIYLDQSGAMNEAFADIVGESIQDFFAISYPLRNQSCGSGDRWIIGEDLLTSGFINGIRDMYNPNCFQDPRSVNDTNFIYCGSEDQGGVHTNSGIVNQVYSLLVDGGSLNGFDVSGLGLLKSFHIFMRTMMVKLTPSSNFNSLSVALQSSCNDLIGLNLTDPVTGNVTSFVIASSDCDTSLQSAINATELTLPFCANGANNTSGAPVVFFSYPPIGEVGNITTIVSFLTYPTFPPSFNATCLMVDGNFTQFVVPASLRVFEFFFLFLCPVITSDQVDYSLVVTVSADGFNYSPVGSVFTFKSKIEVLSISPTEGAVEGGTIVTVIGNNFEEFFGCQPFPTIDVNGHPVDCLTCIFGNVSREQPIAANLINNTAITCTAPSFFDLSAPQRQVNVWVSKNSQLFTSSQNITFTYLVPTSATRTPTHRPRTNSASRSHSATRSRVPVSHTRSRSTTRTGTPVSRSTTPSHTKAKSRTQSPRASSASLLSSSILLLTMLFFAVYL